MLADGINSTSDVAYGIIVKVFIRMANKPADDDRPYGHRQLESIAALIVGAFVLTAAGSMIFSRRELPLRGRLREPNSRLYSQWA